MDDWWRYKDPEDMTPEQRMKRLIELMAIAVVRLVEEEKQGIKREPESKPIAVDPRLIKRKGPLPFGYQMTERGIEMIASEKTLMDRMKELAASGMSLEKIAKVLSEEGHRTKRGAKWTRSLVWRILKRHART